MMQLMLELPCPLCHGSGHLPRRPQVTGYVRRQMLSHIIAASASDGICAEELFQKLYCTDPNCGPVTGIRVISVLVWNANKQLKPQGFKIVCRWRGGRGGHSPYVLVKLDADTERKPAADLHLGSVEGTQSAGAASDH